MIQRTNNVEIMRKTRPRVPSAAISTRSVISQRTRWCQDHCVPAIGNHYFVFSCCIHQKIYCFWTIHSSQLIKSCIEMTKQILFRLLNSPRNPQNGFLKINSIPTPYRVTWYLEGRYAFNPNQYTAGLHHAAHSPHPLFAKYFLLSACSRF